MKKLLMYFVMILLISGMLNTANALEYSISNGGAGTAISPLSGAMSAAAYYNRISPDGFPAFGTEADTAFTWLWEDTTTNEISLGIIFHTKGPAAGGIPGTIVAADIAFSGIPGGAYWSVQDDIEAYPYTMSLVRWGWGRHTDGGVISGLNGEWIINIGLYSGADARPLGVDNWYFLSSDSGKYANAINISRGLTITASDGLTPVPEPSTVILLGTGLIGFIGFGRKKFLNI
jgi:hypothetical protein